MPRTRKDQDDCAELIRRQSTPYNGELSEAAAWKLVILFSVLIVLWIVWIWLKAEPMDVQTSEAQIEAEDRCIREWERTNATDDEALWNCLDRAMWRP